MILDKVFWIRTKGSITQAFSYAKDTQAINFAKKYGGNVIKNLEVDDTTPEGEIWSYLENADPVEVASDVSTAGSFKVYIKSQNNWKFHNSFSNISDANTEAKNIIKSVDRVIVVREE